MDQTLVATKYWKKNKDGRVVCTLCPRFCRLKEGQRGFCFVRACRDGQIVLTTYGRSSGFCVDPIEKKPLHHFLPGTPVLSFGTAGCNLSCRFCQNWDISKARDFDILADTATPEMIAARALELGCRSVAFTYNDPVIFHEYAIDVAKACHRIGIKTVAVTAAYVCESPRKAFYDHIDAANIDLKAFTDDFYRKFASGRLQPVLNTLSYLRDETDVWLELTTLLIPGKNDSDTEIDAMTRWIVKRLGPDVPLHFTAFHPDYKMRDHPPTSRTSLISARRIALENGIRYAYTGNVYNPRGERTQCPQCAQTLIGRQAYLITDWNLTNGGHCRFCNTVCAGLFEDAPGHWGAKRMAVRFNQLST
ncbi:MAG: AmmeMemoRadiSam system radical SAM enzyme [Nitrospiria bacterium]